MADRGVVVVLVAGELVELVLVVVFVPDHAGGVVTQEVRVAVGVSGRDCAGFVLWIGKFPVLDHIRQVLIHARVLMAGVLVADVFHPPAGLAEPLEKAHVAHGLVLE
ncbi:hypothetical protein D3C80_1372150 [compost metagenome]